MPETRKPDYFAIAITGHGLYTGQKGDSMRSGTARFFKVVGERPDWSDNKSDKEEGCTMGVVIGIDTGGTYTDAVVCETSSREIYAQAKALTTHEDLSVGIYQALVQIPEEYRKMADTVSLSTTLTTNACVEKKGCRALLILFGVEEQSARRMGAEFGGYDSEDIWFLDTRTDSNGNIGNMPDWEAFSEAISEVKQEYQAYAVVEIYARKTAARLEKEARDRIRKLTGRPVVCGFELFSELNVLKRGSNALLNARLIPLIHQFMDAVRSSLQKLDMGQTTIMIVRSDGTLMSADYAVEHPLDTVLCGPAASAIGAKMLTDCTDAMIIDMGGTTSDLALLQNGMSLRVEDYVHIGGYTTFMKGFFIDTFALGGDTGVLYKDDRLYLGIRRMIPICILASQYPFLEEELKNLSKTRLHTRRIYEYLVLQHPLPDSNQYDDLERRICKLLEKRPRSIQDVAERLGCTIYDISTEKLEKNGILLRSGLTPTDIMHIKGDFTRFSVQAAWYCLEYVARNVGLSPQEAADQIYSLVKYRLFSNVARVLMKCSDSQVETMDPQVLEHLLQKQWKEYQMGDSPETRESCRYFCCRMQARLPLIGIGGPSAVLLPDVAEALGTRAVIPPYSRTANAAGAALGCVTFSITGTVECIYKEEKGSHLIVSTKGENVLYELDDLEQAVAYAENRMRDLAAREAEIRGMKGTPQITIKTVFLYYDAEKSMLNRVRVTAQASEPMDL